PDRAGHANAALARVLSRLRANPGADADQSAAPWEGPKRTWSPRPTFAAAAVLVVAVGTAIVWPRGVRVYAAGIDGLQVTLADDSRVEMRAHSEMAVGRASDGIQI